MTQYLCVVLLVGMAATSAFGEDAVFHKSTTFDSHGNGHKVDLVFLSGNKALVVREKTAIVANVPFGSIDKVSYTYSKSHRVKEGAEVMMSGAGSGFPAGIVTLPAGLLLGSGIMLSKQNKHWLYVDYKDAGGSKQLALKLDKSEYQKVIAATKAQTGRDVEILPEEGKQKK